MVNSRARGSLMARTPSMQTTISMPHIAASNQRGIERRTDGTNVAATMPMHSAIENCNPVGAPTPTTTHLSRGVLIGDSYVHNRPLVRCISGWDADPLSVQASFLGFLWQYF